MKIFVVLAALACLTVEVSAGLGQKLFQVFSGPKEDNSRPVEPDFRGLNLYLLKKVDSQEAGANLEAIRTKIVSLNKPTKKITAAIKRAGEIFVELSEQSECTDEAKKNLKSVATAGLRLQGTLRHETIIRPYLEKLLDSCASKFDPQNVEQTFVDQAADHKELADLVEAVAPGYRAQKLRGRVMTYMNPMPRDRRGSKDIIKSDVLPLFRNRILSLAFQPVETKDLFHYVQAALRNAGHQVTKDRRAEFDVSFDEHFLQPCQRFRSTVGRAVDDARLLYSFRDDDEKAEFIKNQSATFRRLGWTDKICSMVTEMQNGAKVREVMFDKLAEKPWAFEWQEVFSPVDHRHMGPIEVVDSTRQPVHDAPDGPLLVVDENEENS